MQIRHLSHRTMASQSQTNSVGTRLVKIKCICNATSDLSCSCLLSLGMTLDHEYHAWEMKHSPSDFISSIHNRFFLQHALSKAVKSQSEIDDFADITVEVDGKLYKTHKFIMCAYSGYFRALASSGMKESIENKVSLKDISQDTFEVILDMIFKCKIGLHYHNALDVLHAVNRLEMLPLIDLCKSFVRDILNLDNCFEIYRNMLLLDEDIAEMSWDFILAHFDECKASKIWEFQSLSYEEIQDIMENPKLKTASEGNVVDVVIDWTFGDHGMNVDALQQDAPMSEIYPRSQHLYDLLQKCRLLFLTGSHLQNLLVRNTFLQQLSEAKSLLEKCLTWKLEGNGVYNASSILSTHRELDKKNNVLISVSTTSGGNATSEKSTVEIWQLEKCSSSLCKPTQFCSLSKVSFIAAAVWQDQIFAISTEFCLYSASLLISSPAFTSVAPNIVLKNSAAIVALQGGLCIASSLHDQHGVDPLQSRNRIKVAGPLNIRMIYLSMESTVVAAVNIGSTQLCGFTSNQTVIIFSFSQNNPDVTQMHCCDSANGLHALFMEEFDIYPRNLSIFQTIDQTFFLFDNGALYRLVPDKNSVGSVKSQYITHLWNHNRKVIRGAQIINKVLHVFGGSTSVVEKTVVSSDLTGGAFSEVRSVKEQTGAIKYQCFLNAAMSNHLLRKDRVPLILRKNRVPLI